MNNPSWLQDVSQERKAEILELRSQRFAFLNEERYQTFQKALEQAPEIQVDSLDLSQDIISMQGNPSSEEQDSLHESLKAFIPWKKGPFNFFGTTIDSEWQSQDKWNRLGPHIGSLEGQVIADVGCNNGYFMFRMAEHKPRLVLGIEPVAKNYYNFQLINKYAKQDNLHFELFGMEHLDLFPKSFDTIFCLGILYHHTDPIGLLRKARTALKKGGQLIIDCQGIAGDEPVAYMPPGKYAGGRGFWFLPTLSCLENWVKRSGFQHVDVLFESPLSVDEQRSSEWAPIKSLKEFLSPCQTKTVEGHPAPHRFYLKARV